MPLPRTESYTTFTDSDGSPWPGGWTAVFSVGSTSQESGFGRIALPGTSDFEAMRLATLPPTGQVELVGSAKWVTSSAVYVYWYFDIDTTGNGQLVRITGTGVEVLDIAAYATETSLATISNSITSGTEVHYRIWQNGSALKVRVWNGSAAEPTTWGAEVTAANSTGPIALAAESFSGAVNVDHGPLRISNGLSPIITSPTVSGVSTSRYQLAHPAPTYGGSPKLIAYCHGAYDGSAEEVATPGSEQFELWGQVVIDSGGEYVLVACTDGVSGSGYTTGMGWGSDASFANLETLITWGLTQFTGDTKAVIVGHSAGAMTGINWAYRNQTRVSSLAFVEALLRPDYLVNNVDGSFETELDVPYGGSGGWDANKATRDPELLTSSSAWLRSKHLLDYYSPSGGAWAAPQSTGYRTAHGVNCTLHTVTGTHATAHLQADVAEILRSIRNPTFAHHAGVSTEVGTSLGSSNAVSLPTDSVAGDYIQVTVVNDNTSTTAITASTGWTTISTATQGSNVIKGAVFGRVLDGSGNDTLAISGAAQDYCVAVERVTCHAVTTVSSDVKVANAVSASNGNADPPNLSPGSTADWLWIAAGMIDMTNAADAMTADPSGYTSSSSLKSASSTTSCGLRVAYKTASGSSENPGAFTNTSRAWAAFTVAIPPHVLLATQWSGWGINARIV